jgi:hypothetical protein
MKWFCWILGHKWFKNAYTAKGIVYVCDRCGKHKIVGSWSWDE